MAEMGTVCVTGAGGFTGSWVVKGLLSKGYKVHGTVREPSDPKNSHLRKLDKASENLELFKATLLDYNSIYAAVKDCIGVIHVASPLPSSTVPHTEVDMVEPAVKGTLNVLKASHEAKVKRVVVVSSSSSVINNPVWPKGKVMDETCWSDQQYCRTTEQWYCLSKTAAESQAFDYAKTSGLDVVTVCPTWILGPVLQSTVNGSSLYLLSFLKERDQPLPNTLQTIIDVRDLADALILAFEKPEAEGRYICTAHSIKTHDLVDKLRSLNPNYNYPRNFTEAEIEGDLSSEKLQKLGWTYRPLEDTLADSIESYKRAGFFD